VFRSAAYLQSLRAGPGFTGHYAAPLDDALRHPRLLVVGEANSGKSTFLRQLACLWAGAMLDVRVDTLLFPLLIRGEDLADHVGRYCEVADASRFLAAFFLMRNQQSGWGLDEEFFSARLAQGACLILVDGLDRIPAGRDCDVISRMLEALSASGPLNRMVVATRPDAIPELAGFVPVRIGPPES